MVKWFDRWVEKQYLKKHPPMRKVTAIEVKQVHPVEIEGCVSISDYDLELVDEEDIYASLIHSMMPELKSYISICVEQDIKTQSYLIAGKISAYPNSRIRPNWFGRLKSERF